MADKDRNPNANKCQPGKKKGVKLPVLADSGSPTPNSTRRASTMGKKRAVALLIVNLLIIAHIIQWKITGRTVSPIEPSESTYFISQGELNAGALLFGASLLATLVLGRFFCGWACHIVALQDLCAWMMKKIGIRPQPFRSRFLFHAPFALAIYMFVWPFLQLWWIDRLPSVSNHLMTTEFWATFPGPGMAALTFLTCGFLIVYILGAKGFCTYGCPYGGFFAPLDKLSPVRIRVTDDCEQCGHCTAACTSNVRVHEEVAKFKMVVDPGCMKCLDCVSVCPNDALYVGIGRPAIGAKPDAPVKPVSYDFTLGEELVMLVLGLIAIVVYRALYDAVPLLMTMAVAAIIAFMAIKAWRMIRHAHVRLQNLQLKKAGSITSSGYAFLAATALVALFTIHSGLVQYYRWQGAGFTPQMTEGIWVSGNRWYDRQPQSIRAQLDEAIRLNEKSIELGLFAQPKLMQETVTLYVARGRIDDAEKMARLRMQELPGVAESYFQLASVLQVAGKHAESELQLAHALRVDPCSAISRSKLAGIKAGNGESEAAIKLLDEADDYVCDYEQLWFFERANLYARLGQRQKALASVEALLRNNPDSVRIIFEMATLQMLPPAPDLAGAAMNLQKALEIDPCFFAARSKLALIRAQRSQIGDALDVLDAADQHACQEEAHWLLERANLYAQFGQKNKAIVAVEKVLSDFPDSFRAHYEMGVLLMLPPAPDFSGSAIHLEKAIALSPEFANAHYNLAVARFSTKRFDEAERHVRESIRLSPNDPQNHAFLSVVLRELGKNEESMQAQQKAVELQQP